jgi:transposase-like protein
MTAVLAVITEGSRVSEVAEKFGVHRDTVHSWLARYEPECLEGLRDRSHRPRTSPLQMPAMIEARVLELRRKRPTGDHEPAAPAGPRRCGTALVDLGHLSRLAASRPDRAQGESQEPPDLPTLQAGRPMELWQMDVVGGGHLEDGAECKVLTGVDDHSLGQSIRSSYAVESAGEGGGEPGHLRGP